MFAGATSLFAGAQLVLGPDRADRLCHRRSGHRTRAESLWSLLTGTIDVKLRGTVAFLGDGGSGLRRRKYRRLALRLVFDSGAT